MNDVEKALYTAQEAKALAESANRRIDDLSGHLATISAGIEGVRRDNSEQHSSNARKLDDGFDKVHARISSVKQTQDDDRKATAIQFGDVEKTIMNAASTLGDKIKSVQVEARAGDAEIKHQQTARWLLITLTFLKYAAIIGVTLVAGHYGFQLQLPG